MVCLNYDPVFMPRQSRIDTPGSLHHIAGGKERKRMLCFCDNFSKCKSYGHLIMSKVIPINKDLIKDLSDTKSVEIEKDLMEFFHDAIQSNGGNTPIFQAKEYANKFIAKKHNFTIDQAKEFVSEMQMRKLDKDIGLSDKKSMARPLGWEGSCSFSTSPSKSYFASIIWIPDLLRNYP